jgi:hypothetical protein
VDKSDPELGYYDMIIGRDLMHLFSKAQMLWDNVSICTQASKQLDNTSVDPFEQKLLLIIQIQLMLKEFKILSKTSIA